MTILAFIDYSSSMDKEDIEIIETKQWLSLSIGILGIVSTVLTSIMINTKYQAQHSAHAAAERSLSKICQQVRFPDGKSLVDHINTQKGIYLAMSYSDIPTKISQPFRDLQHVMNNKPYMFRAIQYERCYYYLYKSFMKKRYLWPIFIREINIISNSNTLGRLIEEEYAKYTKGMEEVQKKSSRSIVVYEDSGDDSSSRIQQRQRRRRSSSNVHSVKSDHSNSSDDEYEEFTQSLLRRSSSTASSTVAQTQDDPPV